MKSKSIAIVGMGCVLPGAENVEQFWNNCREGISFLSPLSKSRWDSSLFLSDDRLDTDKTYSVLAGEVTPETYDKLSKKYAHGLQEITRMELLLAESCQQALANVNISADRKKIGLVMGVMSPSDEHFLAVSRGTDEKILNYLREHITPANMHIVDSFEKMLAENKKQSLPKNLIHTSEILESVAEHFKIQGMRFIIDAACASSLASIDQCCQFLNSGELDMAIAGGMETNLSPISFNFFARVYALAKNHSLPFDKKTEGLAQGEGAGVVVLKRLADAIADKDHILAVIDGIDGSSDGRTTSLFQPNEKGQELLFGRVYSNLADKKIDYLEGHGTGTVVGDRTEINSASRFFSDQKSLPMGSLKYLTGHTKGAAGIANLIKAVKVINEKIIPGMPYLKVPLENSGTIVFNQKETVLSSGTNLRVGVSAFGFGGANYHTAISEFTATSINNSIVDHQFGKEKVYLISEAEVAIEDFDPSWFTSLESVYRLPPQSIPYIDRSQLLAVKASELAMAKANIKLDIVPNDEVIVISASTLGLEILQPQTARLQSTMLIELIAKNGKSGEMAELIKLIGNYREQFIPFNKDSVVGTLNNVIAGRVCNAFDFRGKSFNIEARNKVNDLALRLAMLELSSKHAPLVFLITGDEEIDHKEFRVRRKKIKCQILCNHSYAEKNFVKPKGVLNLIKDHSIEIHPSGIDFKVEILENSDTEMNQSAVLFPGQGAMHANRYANYVGYSEEFIKKFQQADQLALKYEMPPISALANEEQRRLDDSYPNAFDTLRSNLFQFTTQVTFFELLLKVGIYPEVITGHSFGEISVLHCVGLYSFERAFEIIQIREKACPMPGEIGTLVAISLSNEKFLKLNLETKCSVANINSKDQIVLSVKAEYLTALLLELRNKRVAAKELRIVGRPYHSFLMLEAAERFEKELNQLDWEDKSVSFTFISSVNGEVYPRGSLIKKEMIVKLLVDQLVNPVYFDRQVMALQNHRIKGFVELGLDRNLLSFVQSTIGKNKDNEKEYTMITAEELLLKKKKVTPQKVFKLSNNKYTGMVANVISLITGYKIEEITLEQQFEEDLRIDSIKKAEIFFRCLEETKGESDTLIEISNFKQVGDIVEFFQNNEASLHTNKVISEAATFSVFEIVFKKSDFIFTARKNHPDLLRINLFEEFDVNIPVKSQVGFSRQTISLELSENKYSMRPSDLAGQLTKLASMVSTLTSSFENPTIILHSDSDNSFFRGCCSFLKSYRFEQKNYSFKSVIDSGNMFIETWRIEAEDLLISDVIWKGKERFTRTIKEVATNEVNVKATTLFSIGGSKGILRNFFSNIDEFLIQNLFFTGRSHPDSLEVQESIIEFKRRFKSVTYFQMDATDQAQIFSGIEKCLNTFGAIDIFLDASGQEVSNLFAKKNIIEIEGEISSKFLVRENINQAFDHFGLHSIKRIGFNSIAAMYGNQGQTVYSFTNGYAAKMAQGIHLALPPLDGVGMISNNHQKNLKMMGVDLLSPDVICKLLIKVIGIKSNDNSIDCGILSLRNHFVMNLLSAPPHTITATFGKVVVNQKEQIKWTLDKNLTPYLQDHLVGSKCVAPLAMGLANFALAGKVFFQRLPTIKNFVLHNFILLDRGPIDISMSMKFGDDKSFLAKIYSKYENYEALVNDYEDFDENQNQNQSHNKEQFINQEAYGEFVLEEFYSKKFIEYGPSFQVLSKVSILNNNEIFSFCEANSFTRTGDQDFDYFTTMYEACVQTAATKCLLDLKVLVLPLGVGEVVHYQKSHTNKIFLVASDLGKGSDSYHSFVDVKVFNENGSLICLMKDLKLKKFVQFNELPLMVMGKK